MAESTIGARTSASALAKLSPKRRAARSQVASLTRSRPADDPELVEARRQLAIARFEDRIAAAVADAPRLPDDVVDRCTRTIRAAAQTEAVAA